MYNSQRFEEAAFDIYLSGMHDYESICEKLIMEKYDDYSDIQEILDDAQKLFEDKAGTKVKRNQEIIGGFIDFLNNNSFQLRHDMVEIERAAKDYLYYL